MGATSDKHAPPFGARRAVPKGRPAAKRAASPEKWQIVAQRASEIGCEGCFWSMHSVASVFGP